VLVSPEPAAAKPEEPAAGESKDPVGVESPHFVALTRAGAAQQPSPAELVRDAQLRMLTSSKVWRGRARAELTNPRTQGAERAALVETLLPQLLAEHPTWAARAVHAASKHFPLTSA
jgi:hypothetical protein